MPELPEVETVKKSLNLLVKEKVIKNVRIYFNNNFKGLGIVENKVMKRYIAE